MDEDSHFTCHAHVGTPTTDMEVSTPASLFHVIATSKTSLILRQRLLIVIASMTYTSHEHHQRGDSMYWSEATVLIFVFVCRRPSRKQQKA